MSWCWACGAAVRRLERQGPQSDEHRLGPLHECPSCDIVADSLLPGLRGDHFVGIALDEALVAGLRDARIADDATFLVRVMGVVYEHAACIDLGVHAPCDAAVLVDVLRSLSMNVVDGHELRGAQAIPLQSDRYDAVGPCYACNRSKVEAIRRGDDVLLLPHYRFLRDDEPANGASNQRRCTASWTRWRPKTRARKEPEDHELVGVHQVVAPSRNQGRPVVRDGGEHVEPAQASVTEPNAGDVAGSVTEPRPRSALRDGPGLEACSVTEPAAAVERRIGAARIVLPLVSTAGHRRYDGSVARPRCHACNKATKQLWTRTGAKGRFRAMADLRWCEHHGIQYAEPDALERARAEHADQEPMAIPADVLTPSSSPRKSAAKEVR